MIPLKLSVRNFMCYRGNVPPLFLEGFQVACLCGDNGAGKSALIDAITWVLWGKARAKNDDDLVHQGQADMEVELEFLIGRERYRVLRKHTKSGSDRYYPPVLELQVAADGGFKPLTGNSLRETEEKIITLLRMDYQTFINSTLLLQGRANEFSLKSPSDRKEILASILNLAVFDELEEKAKNLSKEKRSASERLKASLAEIELELAHKKEYESELEMARLEQTKFEDQIKIQEEVVSSLRRGKEVLETKREQLAELGKFLEEAKVEQKKWEIQLEKHQKRVKDYETIISHREDIERGYTLFRESKELNDDLNEKLSVLLHLRERRRKLEKVIYEAREELVLEQGKAQNRLEDKENRAKRLSSLEKEQAEILECLARLKDQKELLENKKDLIQKLSDKCKSLELLNERLEKEIEINEEKLRLLSQGDARCPLCESELGRDSRERIVLKLESELKTKRDDYQANLKELEQRRLEHQVLQREISEAESLISEEQSEKWRRLSFLENNIVEAREASREAIQEKKKLARLQRCLASGDYALAEQQALAKLGEEQSRLGYDEEKHEKVRRQLEQFQKYERLKQELMEAERFTLQEKDALSKVEETLVNLHSKIREVEQREAVLRNELNILPSLAIRLEQAEKACHELKEHSAQWRDKVATLEERLRHCYELEKSRVEKEKLLRQTLEEEQIYKELTEAFGKRGIQALLIEKALPEIEVEANRLLGKMTDNRLSLKLETQRATKKGGVVETLDIKISDELGTRNYEMYSGGEAFRIDLALRIALSKLLVKRAGASLPILIIDEGFGNQDSSGREKLVQTINSIQDDFEKILVITHLEELKDAFPVRIDIIKTPEGSRIFLN